MSCSGPAGALMLTIALAAGAQTAEDDQRGRLGPSEHSTQPGDHSEGASGSPPRAAAPDGDGSVPCATLELTDTGGYLIAPTFALLATAAHVQDHHVQPGGGIGTVVLGYISRDSLAMRVRTDMWIGGDSGGLQGALRLDFALGWSGVGARGYGPFIRGGLRGQLHDNGDLLASFLNLPQLEAGLQSISKSWYWELAGQAGPLLSGHYHPGDWRRQLGPAPSWGARGTLGLRRVFVEAEWIRARTASFEPRTPVDMVLGTLCAQLSKLGLCLEARHYRGEAALPDGEFDLRHSSVLSLLAGAPIPCPDEPAAWPERSRATRPR